MHLLVVSKCEKKRTTTTLSLSLSLIADIGNIDTKVTCHTTMDQKADHFPEPLHQTPARRHKYFTVFSLSSSRPH